MKVLGKIFAALAFIFLYAPLIVMIVFSFNSTKSTSVMKGFSLQWYKGLFENGTIMVALRNTIILAVLSSVIAVVLGTLASVGLYYLKNKPVKKTLMSLTNIPMMNPDIVTGFSMMLLFTFAAGMLGMKTALGFPTMLIAHITFSLPYVILNVKPSLDSTDVFLQYAAEDLGCNKIQAFFKVILPCIRSGIISGFIMAFTLSLDDFVITYFTSGTDFQTLPLYIYSMKRGIRPNVYALYSLIFVSVLILLVLSNYFKSKSIKSNKQKEIEI